MRLPGAVMVEQIG